MDGTKLTKKRKYRQFSKKKAKYSKLPKGLEQYGKAPLAISRCCELANTGVNGVAFGAFAFKLSDVPNSLEFNGMFDQYCITGVKLYIIPTHNQREIGTGTYSPQIPIMYYWIDTNDAVPVGSLNTCFEQSNLKMARLDEPFSIYLVPNAIGGILGPASINNYETKTPGKTWIATSDLDARHYGFKYGISAATTTDFHMNFKIIAKYYIKLRYGH